MIEGYDIICFSGDWKGDPLSKRHIMLRLARRNRVLWVNSIGNRNPVPSARDFERAVAKVREFLRGYQTIGENLFVYSPLLIPFHGYRAARVFNRRFLAAQIRQVCRSLSFKKTITWSFAPTAADVVGKLGERFVVYHCVDEFSEFGGVDKEAVRSLERSLIRKSDAVIVASEPLLEAKRRYHPNTFLVTHGVEVDHFRRACDPHTRVPDEIASLPRPVIGFYGLLADWVDLPLIRELALARPTWSFVLIGKSDTDVQALSACPNVYLLGRREYADLPAYAKAFDVALLPFVVNRLTRAANPLKLREYLAAGLPVVASDIPEIRRFSDVLRIANGRDGFLRAIEQVLASGRSGPQLETSRAMDAESWDEKVEELCRIVQRLETARRPWRVTAALAAPASP